MEIGEPRTLPPCGRRPGGRLAGSRWLKWASYLVAAGALTYVVWNLSLADLKTGLSQMIWWPVVLAVLLQTVPRVLQAWRWGYLLRPIRVRIHLLLHAIYVGALMNGVLPLCPSDLVRGTVVARRTRTKAVRVLSLQAVERAADGIALTLLAWLVIRRSPVPAVLGQATIALMVIVGVGLFAGVALTLQHRRLHAYVSPREPRGRLGKALKSGTLEILGAARSVKAWTMPLSITTGVGIVITQSITMWLLLYAYRIDLSILQAAALFGVISIGTVLPTAPGSIGAWQFFCILGLGLFGVPAGQAAAFSVVAFAIWTVPSLLLGVVALILSPISWAELRPGGRAKATGAQAA